MIIEYIQQSLGQEGTLHNTRKGTQYSFKCPFCNDHKERLFINVDREVYWCHNCSTGGTLVSFLSDYAHISYKEALSVYRNYEGYEKELPEELETEIYERLSSPSEVEINKYIHPLPEEFILLEDAKGKVGEQALHYVTKVRGISLEKCSRYYVGYCAEGKYANRIIMPDFEQGDLVYWQGRTWEECPTSRILKKLYRKVLNPSLTKEQIAQGLICVDKSEVVSNIDFILQDGVAVICEGKMDAYTIGDYGACTHGKVISDTQFMKLVSNKNKISTIAIMYDGDAFEYTLRTAKRFYKYFDDVLVCRMEGKEDPNSIGSRECLKRIQDAIPYTPYFEVKARLKGWV